RRHTRSDRDWSSDVCSSDLGLPHPSFLPSPARRGRGDPAKPRGPMVGWEGLGEGASLTDAYDDAADARHAALREQFLIHPDVARSEERRVGKEGRAWWAREA